MRLLLICEDPPSRDPEKGNGSTLISWELVHGLPDDVEIAVVTFGPDAPEQWLLDRCTEIVTVPLRFGSKGPGRLTRSLPDAAWQRADPAAVSAVDRLSRWADVSLLHGIYAGGLADAVRGPWILHEIDPSETHLGNRVASTSGAKKAYAALMRHRTLRMRKGLAARASGWLVVNEDDASRLEKTLGRKVIGVPNGVRVATAADLSQPLADLPSIGFIGSLDWAPNVDVAERLLNTVLPAVKADVPQARLVLAGRKPTEELRRLCDSRDDVELVEGFDALSDVYARIGVLVFPHDQGAGIRNSVIEAVAHGRPVVLAASSGRGVSALQPLLAPEGADDDVALAGQAARLLSDRGSLELRAALTRDAAQSLWSWRHAVGRYREALVAAAGATP